MMGNVLFITIVNHRLNDFTLKKYTKYFIKENSTIRRLCWLFSRQTLAISITDFCNLTKGSLLKVVASKLDEMRPVLATRRSLIMLHNNVQTEWCRRWIREFFTFTIFPWFFRPLLRIFQAWQLSQPKDIPWKRTDRNCILINATTSMLAGEEMWRRPSRDRGCRRRQQRRSLLQQATLTFTTDWQPGA